MSKPDFEKEWEIRGISPQDLLVSEPDNPPPLFFKSKRTGDIFAALDRKVVRASIYFNDDFVIQEGEVHYSELREEWVLGTITLSKKAYHLLGVKLGGRKLLIQTCPVTEHIPPGWGPVTP